MTPECRKTIQELIMHFKYKCTVDTFKEYEDKVWTAISKYEYLSEDFIIGFRDEVDWDYISAFQKLSEKFIREFQDRVYWPWLSYTQTLSEDFIREFQHKIRWEMLMLNDIKINFDNFSDLFFLEFADKIKNCGTEEQIQRLEKIQNKVIDRTYDIIF